MLRSLLSEWYYIIPAVVIALSFHEFAHSLIAYKLGDRSQKDKGRLTLNPLNHLDPMGVLCLVITGFGWAKPVQVDTYFFKDRKNGMIYSAMAGPVANLILGFVVILILTIMQKTMYFQIMGNQILYFVFRLLSYTATINIGLGVFNLIPIPPLDGSKILLGIVNEDTYFKILQYENYLSLALIVILITGVLDGPLIYARSTIFTILQQLADMLTVFL